MIRILLLCLVLSSSVLAAPKEHDFDPANQNRAVWFDLATRDVARSCAFYHGVFGWEFTTIPDFAAVAHIVSGDRMIGTLRKSDDFAHTEAGVVYIQVASVAESVATAQALGGTIRVRPFELAHEQGWIAIVVDPTGQPIGLWSPTLPANQR